MLRDLGRVDQLTNPPVTAITMFPIAQLIVVVELVCINEEIETVLIRKAYKVPNGSCLYIAIRHSRPLGGSAVKALQWDLERSG
jgi:hypothetical protein